MHQGAGHNHSVGYTSALKSTRANKKQIEGVSSSPVSTVLTASLLHTGRVHAANNAHTLTRLVQLYSIPCCWQGHHSTGHTLGYSPAQPTTMPCDLPPQPDPCPKFKHENVQPQLRQKEKRHLLRKHTRFLQRGCGGPLRIEHDAHTWIHLLRVANPCSRSCEGK